MLDTFCKLIKNKNKQTNKQKNIMIILS